MMRALGLSKQSKHLQVFKMWMERIKAWVITARAFRIQREGCWWWWVFRKTQHGACDNVQHVTSLFIGLFCLAFRFHWGWLIWNLWRRVNDKNPFKSIFGLWNRKPVKSNLQPVITRCRSTTLSRQIVQGTEKKKTIQRRTFYCICSSLFHHFSLFWVFNTESEANWDARLGFLVVVWGSARYTVELNWTLRNPIIPPVLAFCLLSVCAAAGSVASYLSSELLQTLAVFFPPSQSNESLSSVADRLTSPCVNELEGVAGGPKLGRCDVVLSLAPLWPYTPLPGMSGCVTE